MSKNKVNITPKEIRAFKHSYNIANTFSSVIADFRCVSALMNIFSMDGDEMEKDFLEHRLERMKTSIKSKSKGANPLACGCCGRKTGILICITCDRTRCLFHLYEPILHSTAHTVFYDPTGQLFCAECNEFYEVSEYINRHRPGHNLSESSSKTMQYTLKGIHDFGKTNFIAAVIQVIINTEEIFNHYFSFHHSQEKCKNDRCTDCFFKNIYSMIYSDQGVDMSKPLVFLARNSNEIVSQENNDASYAFNMLVNLYHSKDQVEPERCGCIMHDVFFGDLRSAFRCASCGNHNIYSREFCYLQLSSNDNICDALHRYFFEYFEDGVFMCPSCHSNRQSPILREIHRFPRILTLSFQRFDEVTLNKKKFKLKFQDTLDIGDAKYELCSFIDHSGNYPGKYASYVLIKDTWFEFNNEHVIRDVNIEYKFPGASILFYRRK